MEDQSTVVRENQDDPVAKPKKRKLSKRKKRLVVILLWLGLLSPTYGLILMIWVSSSNIPSFEQLENSKSLLASTIYTSDNVEMGRYFRKNRTTTKFHELSPYLINALIATEDERFREHSGVDFRATARVIKGMLSGDKNKGGGSTISQQLAKQLFPRPSGIEEGSKIEFAKRKFWEWIVASKLERSYSKDEIITSYFNTIEFLNNAIGIRSASRVYFNSTPDSLMLHEAAMLVGMAKNPSLFNPLRRPDTVKHRRMVVLGQMVKNGYIDSATYNETKDLPLGLNYTKVDHQEGIGAYFRESLRDEVSTLFRQSSHHLWIMDTLGLVEKNEAYLDYNWHYREDGEPIYFDLRNAIETKNFQSITLMTDTIRSAEFFKLRILDVEGMVKVELRKFIYAKPNGEPYDLYADGLKIFTTIDSRHQEYAEWAVKEHLKAELQDQFFKNNAKWKRPPFSDDLRKGQIDTIMQQAKRRSMHYKQLTGSICMNCERPKRYLRQFEKDGKPYVSCFHCGHESRIRSADEVDLIMNTPRPMKVFDWKSNKFEKDTVLSPMDSIRYYKSFLRAGLMSMDPKTGFIKAWVGGPHYRHFKYDMVKKGKRQVGSTFKPFVYATAIQNRVIEPCQEFLNIEYCIDVPYDRHRMEPWCPSNSGMGYDGLPTPINYALAGSMNNITAGVMKQIQYPEKVLNFVGGLGLDTASLIPVPSMALGVFDLSIYEMVGATSAFANKGNYIRPIFISRIEDKNGTILYQAVPEINEAIQPDVAYAVLNMMKGVTAGVRHPYKDETAGTAIRIRGSKKRRPYAGLKYPIAGKTGTTQNQSDGWFMGITPDLVAGVWVGGEDRSVRFRSLQLGMGTNMALPIWGYYMNKVYADSTLNISTADFEKPTGQLGIQLDCNQYRQYKNEDFDYEKEIQGAEEEYYGEF